MTDSLTERLAAGGDLEGRPPGVGSAGRFGRLADGSR